MFLPKIPVCGINARNNKLLVLGMNISIEVILFVASVVLAAIGYQLKKSDERITSNEVAIEKVQLTIANDYVKKTEVERLEHAILNKMDRIEGKQDNLLIEISKKQDRV